MPRRVGLLLLLIPALCLVPGLFPVILNAQTPPPITTPPPDPPPPFVVTFDMARVAAETYIPENVRMKGYWSGGGWSGAEGYLFVNFFVSSPVTAEELRWTEAQDTEFENNGNLAPGTFRELYFRVDGMSGEILLKRASDGPEPGPTPGIILGPVEDRIPWSQIAAAGIGIVLISLLLLWRFRSRWKHA